MTLTTPLALEALPDEGSVFVPTLRPTRVLGEANYQATNLRLAISYRVTVVDGKYGVLFTRHAKGRVGLTNEDRKES